MDLIPAHVIAKHHIQQSAIVVMDFNRQQLSQAGCQVIFSIGVLCEAGASHFTIHVSLALVDAYANILEIWPNVTELIWHLQLHFKPTSMDRFTPSEAFLQFKLSQDLSPCTQQRAARPQTAWKFSLSVLVSVCLF